MQGFAARSIRGDIFRYSGSIKRNLSRLANDCLAILDLGDTKLHLTSDQSCASAIKQTVRGLNNQTTPHSVSDIILLDLKSHDYDCLFEKGFSRKSSSPKDALVGYECVFQSGQRDHIVFRNPKQKLLQQEFGAELLGTAWPILRKDCVKEFEAPEQDATTDALIWFVAQKIDLALFVYNASGLMLRMNYAARRLLESERILRRSPKGIVAGNDAETTAFRKAIANCAQSEKPDTEEMLFLSHADSGQKVPVTVSRYMHNGDSTRLAIMMVPIPPAPERIEEIARTQGLSCAEARAATLMQLGLTNKEAAVRAGLKEETFNTYAKRAISKLNVTGRTEMAQLLTWQSAGRLSR